MTQNALTLDGVIQKFGDVISVYRIRTLSKQEFLSEAEKHKILIIQEHNIIRHQKPERAINETKQQY